jgi:hypothetical protein
MPDDPWPPFCAKVAPASISMAVSAKMILCFILVACFYVFTLFHFYGFSFSNYMFFPFLTAK